MLDNWLIPSENINPKLPFSLGALTIELDADTNVPDYDIVIVGYNTSQADTLRHAIFKLYPADNESSILDLGNLITPSPSSFISIYKELKVLNITVLWLGLENSVLSDIVKSFNSLFPGERNLLFDDGSQTQNLNSDLNLSFCGLQSHLLSPVFQADLIKNGSQAINLGALNKDISTIEPLIRESNHIFFCASALKYADAPCQSRKSVSGITSELFCQIMHYAGFNQNCNLLALSDLNDLATDELSQDTFSQGLWYFINAHRSRKNRKNRREDHIYYIVDIDELETPIEFKHNTSSGEWWMSQKSNNKELSIACSHSDYETAMNNQIPERLFELLK